MIRPTLTLIIHLIVAMDARAIITKQVRACVGVDMRTSTQIATARWIVMMDVRAIRIKHPREPVGAEMQTPTPMVMSRQIVMMDVRAIQIKHLRAPVAAGLLKARVAPTTDVGRAMGIQDRVGAVVCPITTAPAVPGVGG